MLLEESQALLQNLGKKLEQLKRTNSYMHLYANSMNEASQD